MGLLTQTLNDRVLNFMHLRRDEMQKQTSRTGTIEVENELENKIEGFIMSVKDSADVLYKL